jgi:hypothetical protein
MGKPSPNLLASPHVKLLLDLTHCIEITLETGLVRYVLRRGKIHRLSETEANETAKGLSEHFRQSFVEGNPLCYSSENFIYGDYRTVESLKDPEESTLDCISAKAVPYSAQLEYDPNERQYYAPLICLRNTKGEVARLGSYILLCSDPFKLADLISNWQEIGLSSDDYRVALIEKDADFDELMTTACSDGDKVIVDPIFSGFSSVSGIAVVPMKELLSEPA